MLADRLVLKIHNLIDDYIHTNKFNHTQQIEYKDYILQAQRNRRLHKFLIWIWSNMRLDKRIYNISCKRLMKQEPRFNIRTPDGLTKQTLKAGIGKLRSGIILSSNWIWPVKAKLFYPLSKCNKYFVLN